MIDLFNTPEDQEQVVDPAKNYIEELVGDGKKFKTIEELARGKFEADSYIQSQNRQLDEMRQAYRELKNETSQRASLEDRLNELSQHLTSSDFTPKANEDNRQPGYDPKELDSFFSTKLKEHKETERQEQNAALVQNKLREKMGTNYAPQLTSQLEELGIDRETFNRLAATSPQLIIKTLGLDTPAQREQFQSPPRSTSTFQPTAKGQRTWSYWEKVRKENRDDYLSQKSQVQMHKDMMDLGEAFYDGDFNL